MPKGAAFFISFAIGFSLTKTRGRSEHSETWFAVFILIYQYYDKDLAIIVRRIFR